MEMKEFGPGGERAPGAALVPPMVSLVLFKIKTLGKLDELTKPVVDEVGTN